MTDSSVRVSVSGDRIATVAINRPEKKNAIDYSTYDCLRNELLRLGDSADVEVVVLRGTHDVFSVGEDLNYLATLDAEDNLADWFHLYKGFVDVTWQLPKMVIAAVFGDAFGIGCELALLADVTFASIDARFGHPEGALGITAPSVWPWLAGPKIAKEYLSSARMIGAAEAQRVRLINKALPREQVDQEVEALARDYASMPPGTAVANKRRLNWAYRDISRVLLDDLTYAVDFGWLMDNRNVDAHFYDNVRNLGFDEALRRRNAPFVKS